ncbi:MAG: alpha-galactosidase [Clostridiales bacterium]|nr:alpha-galactosidase [Clostridiales bacterium]
MSILFHGSSKEFHLTNGKVSYIMEIMENGQMGQLYYGKAVRDRESFRHLHEEMPRSLMPVCVPEPGCLSMQETKQEYPSYGTGDYRMPAVTIQQKNGSRICNFTYQSHEIFAGKPEITPLPATYVEEDSEAETLEILLHDEVTDTDLILSYTIYRDYAVITRHARFLHKGKEAITLDRALSACVEFGDMDFEMIHLAGAWTRERYVKTRKLEMGIQAVQSLRGASSSEHNPFIALKRPNATENQGEVYGFSFVYSGNFLAQVEVNTHDMTRVTMGIHPEMFSWELQAGESFTTPEVVMVYSDQGLNNMSQTYHRLYRTRLVRGEWRDKVRPILLNNWEATYFDFDEEKILNIAKTAKEAGAELFVLDDGWFGNRNDDYRGLGDWYVNLEKLPNGIKGLSEKVEALGLKFGLWVELEMVNKDSDLYRAHPDWVIGVPGRFESHSRHQHVLDFSRKEVVDAIHEMISGVIRESKISYIKWDMNRYITEPYSRGAEASQQGKMMHKYILGVYDLYNRLNTEFPHILFESCASGGARFDPGMLAFAPQTWTSDDTDCGERMKIQYGTSFVYPLVTMGSHVSAVPNHQVYRCTPIATRADVAYFGTFGYELDLNLLSEEEMSQVKEQIKFMKANRELIQMDGDFYRLVSPFEGNDTAWMVVSQDKKEAVAAFYQRMNKTNASWLRLKLEGLDGDTLYEVTYHSGRAGVAEEKVLEAYGDELMYAGLVIDRNELNKNGGDFSSVLYTLKAI